MDQNITGAYFHILRLYKDDLYFPLRLPMSAKSTQFFVTKKKFNKWYLTYVG